MISGNQTKMPGDGKMTWLSSLYRGSGGGGGSGSDAPEGSGSHSVRKGGGGGEGKGDGEGGVDEEVVGVVEEVR